MYTRGLSTRDIEDLLYEATRDHLLSKSQASKVTEVLWEEYRYFQERDLSSLEMEFSSWMLFMRA